MDTPHTTRPVAGQLTDWDTRGNYHINFCRLFIHFAPLSPTNRLLRQEEAEETELLRMLIESSRL
jgi:hypothetical protein